MLQQDRTIHRAIDAVHLDQLFPSPGLVDLEAFQAEEDARAAGRPMPLAPPVPSAALDDWQEAAIESFGRNSLKRVP